MDGFQEQVKLTLKDWQDVLSFAESKALAAILTEKASSAWKDFVLNPMDGDTAMRSSKAEREILGRAAITLRAELTQHFVQVTEAESDTEEENLQFNDDGTDGDGELENVEEDGCADVEKSQVRTLVRRLLQNTWSNIKQLSLIHI